MAQNNLVSCLKKYDKSAQSNKIIESVRVVIYETTWEQTSIICVTLTNKMSEHYHERNYT